MNTAKKRISSRKRRAFSVRRKLMGSVRTNRLCIRRSLRHISAQIIDDIAGVSVVQVTSSSKEVLSKDLGSKTDVSRYIGEIIAQKAIEKGVDTVVFDRKGYPYHGRVKALAEGARSKGLNF